MNKGRRNGKCVPAGQIIMAMVMTGTLLCPSVGLSEQSWWQKGLDYMGGSTSQEKAASVAGDTLSLADVDAGLKEALRVGTENVLENLGRQGGFNADPKIHIPLPASMQVVKNTLDKVGMSFMINDLESRLNQAAEMAMPQLQPLFWQAINEMTLEDARAIYQGPDDAATSYFRQHLSPTLAGQMYPVVEETLAQVNAVQLYDMVMDKYRTFPFVPDVKTDLSNYVVERGLDGIFYYLAREEAAIRSDPAKRTTELLQQVFR